MWLVWKIKRDANCRPPIFRWKQISIFTNIHRPKLIEVLKGAGEGLQSFLFLLVHQGEDPCLLLSRVFRRILELRGGERGGDGAPEVQEALSFLANFCKERGELREASQYCTRLVDSGSQFKEEAKAIGGRSTRLDGRRGGRVPRRRPRPLVRRVGLRMDHDFVEHLVHPVVVGTVLMLERPPPVGSRK